MQFVMKATTFPIQLGLCAHLDLDGWESKEEGLSLWRALNLHVMSASVSAGTHAYREK